VPRAASRSNAADRFQLGPQATQHRFASSIAMERICSLLLDGAVPFDVPLSERAIADTVGLGRMPVREALRDLAREGILSVQAGRGTYLRQLDPQDATELLQVRLALEGMAARLAAEAGFVGELPQVVAALQSLGKGRLAGERIRQAEASGDQVHWLIVQGAGNETLSSLYRGLRLRIAISLRLVQRREVSRIKETIGEHLAIAQAVLSRSPEAAAEAVLAHLTRGHAFTMANFAVPGAARGAGSVPASDSTLARRRGRRSRAAAG